jgi:thiol:disulfide interchange protein
MVAHSVRTVPGRKALFLSGALLVAGLTALPVRAAVKFETNVKTAMARAAKEHKPIMMDVYTDWCGWCHKLDKDVYSRADVTKAVHGGFIALKINPEKDAASKAFVGKYGVEGFPTILFIDAKGKEVYRSVGYRPGPEFLKELKTATAKAKKAPTKSTAKR